MYGDIKDVTESSLAGRATRQCIRAPAD